MIKVTFYIYDTLTLGTELDFPDINPRSIDLCRCSWLRKGWFM
jgi:hypothetical protein